MMKLMKKFFKGILIGIGVLFLLICVFVGYVIVDINKQEKLLENEVRELLKIDLTKDVVEVNIVTKDEYAIIEKIMKEYLRNYSTNYQEYIKSISNFDFENMFTAVTFLNDGPDFVKSKSELANFKNAFNNSMNKLVEMSNKEYIVALVADKDIDEYYVNLYKKYMFGDEINSFDDLLKEDIVEINRISEKVNLFIDDCYKLYDFMSENRNYWNVDGEVVYFTSNELVNEYNAILNKIIMDSSSFSQEEDVTEDNNSDIGSV